jgi:SAM-dependent methyltransferase
MIAPAHANLEPSAWVMRHASFIRPGGRVLDLACGSGRHSRYLAALGCEVVAVDRDEQALESLSAVRGVSMRHCDLEADAWPFATERFDAIVVTNYLHRPLLPLLGATLALDGLLIYETFAQGNQRYGKPSNPLFLLAPGELLAAAHGLRVLAYEDLFVAQPRPALVQRLCARNGPEVPGQPPPDDRIG